MEDKDIKKLASLARIKISEDEGKGFIKDMESILSYVSEIGEVDTGGVNPETLELKNVFREDTNPYKEGIFTEDILNEAPKTEKGYIKVKKIL